ncbi:hypothetical protein N7519_003620 [Penicillium mononematosum]|uniref:uncharacterized protein n=1 Tax=Penicillium mononematosum TaxID=268346 RepID=UPI002547295B|nr:uncharacterized protein N7519_003620 [Penicillium mononematosum]KAJ6188712.1 hypothetical protein N7519_003620 [Penicillium mononematosum]
MQVSRKTTIRAFRCCLQDTSRPSPGSLEAVPIEDMEVRGYAWSQFDAVEACLDDPEKKKRQSTLCSQLVSSTAHLKLASRTGFDS